MVVVDNNVLSALAKIDRLAFLQAVFDQPSTVPAVIDELHRDEVSGYTFVERIDMIKEYNDGWLKVASLRETDLELTETIVDGTLSFTDAECIAVAERRDERLLTDDGHVGEIASQRGVSVWDLPLLLEANIRVGKIDSRKALKEIIADLRDEDNYRFTESDRNALFESVPE